jgi:hypothetical protein
MLELKSSLGSWMVTGARKIRVDSNFENSRNFDKGSSLGGITLEWKWLIPGFSYWRLMDGDKILTSIKRKINGSAGARNYFYTASFGDTGIEFRLQVPKFVDYHASHKTNYPPETISAYSIKSWKTKGTSTKGDTKNEIGKLEHHFGPHLSPTNFHLNDYGKYSIELMLENNDKRGYRITTNDETNGLRVLAVTSRSRAVREYRTFDPGTFRLLDYRNGDPSAELIAIIGFSFADIVHLKYDWGIL